VGNLRKVFGTSPPGGFPDFEFAWECGSFVAPVLYILRLVWGAFVRGRVGIVLGYGKKGRVVCWGRFEWPMSDVGDRIDKGNMTV
jgi:hypothetical protein